MQDLNAAEPPAPTGAHGPHYCLVTHAHMSMCGEQRVFICVAHLGLFPFGQDTTSVFLLVWFDALPHSHLYVEQQSCDGSCINTKMLPAPTAVRGNLVFSLCDPKPEFTEEHVLPHEAAEPQVC